MCLFPFVHVNHNFTFNFSIFKNRISLALLLLVLPCRMFYGPTREYLALVCCEILAAPWKKVHFASIFLADQLTSLTRVLVDIQYMLCFFFSGDFRDLNSDRCAAFVSQSQWVVLTLPFWFRLCQSLRRYSDDVHHAKQFCPCCNCSDNKRCCPAYQHVINCIKYASSLLVVTFSLLQSAYPQMVRLVLVETIDNISLLIYFYNRHHYSRYTTD